MNKKNQDLFWSEVGKWIAEVIKTIGSWLHQAAGDGILGPLVALIGVLISFGALLFAFYQYRKNGWHATLSLRFARETFDHMNIEIEPSNAKLFQRKEVMTLEKIGYLGHAAKLKVAEDILRKKGTPDLRHALHLVKLDIRNTGRGDLRFGLPVLKDALGLKRTPVPVAIVKNGKEKISPQTEMLSLANGEAITFAYSVYSLSKLFDSSITSALTYVPITSFRSFLVWLGVAVYQLDRRSLNFQITVNNDKKAKVPFKYRWELTPKQLDIIALDEQEFEILYEQGYTEEMLDSLMETFNEVNSHYRKRYKEGMSLAERYRIAIEIEEILPLYGDLQAAFDNWNPRQAPMNHPVRYIVKKHQWMLSYALMEKIFQEVLPKIAAKRSVLIDSEYLRMLDTRAIRPMTEETSNYY